MKLSPEDHRELITSHHRAEIARLEHVIRQMEFDAVCERITRDYKIDHEKQNVDLMTGEIVEKENSNAKS